MKTSATFNELKEKGIKVEFVTASQNYDMTSVVKLESRDGTIIYASYWIGDKSFRYVNSLNGILTGEGAIRFDDCMMHVKEFKDVNDFDIYDFVIYDDTSFRDKDGNFDKESIPQAKKLAFNYLTNLFN